MEIERQQDSEQEIGLAWSKEIERRLAEVDAGSVELIHWEELRSELLSVNSEPLQSRIMTRR